MLVANRYRILRHLGSGSMAVVFEACDTWTERHVALKLPRTQQAEALLAHERRLLRRFEHPAVMRAYGSGVLDAALDDVPAGARFSIVELCDGVDASELPADDVRALASMGLRIAAALAALHANGVRHGDVTPRNIRVSADGTCKLIDFSLGSTRTAQLAAGTLETMAPEALAGHGGRAADVYALAATIASLLGLQTKPGMEINAPVLGEALSAMTSRDPNRRADAATACALFAPYADDAARELLDVEMQPARIVGGIASALVAQAGRHVVSGPRGSGKSSVLDACAALAEVDVLNGASGALDIFGAVPREKLAAFAIIAPKLPAVVVVDDVPAGSLLDELSHYAVRTTGTTWIQSSTGGVVLEPLTREDVGEMIAAARPLRPHDRHAADALHTATKGHPAAVVATLAAYPGDALMAERDTLRVPAPTTNEGLVAVVSLFYRGVRASLLRSLTSVDTTRLAALLDRGELIARGDTLETPHRFPWQGLAEPVAHELVRALNPREHALALVRVHHRIGEHTTARELAAVAGARAEADERYDEALSVYEAGLDWLGDGPPDARLAIGGARCLLALGRYADVLPALDLVTAHPERRAIAGEALVALGRYRDAADILEAAPRENEPHGRIVAARARALMLAGRYEDARAYALAANADDKRVELMNVAGVSAFYLGAMADARTLLSEALALAREPKLVESTRANLALVLHKAGDTRAAEAAYVRCIDELTQWNDLPRKLLRVTNLATLRQEVGQIGEALTTYAEASELARLTGNDRALVRVLLNRANLLVWLGALGEARGLIDKARATADAHKLTLEAAYLTLIEVEAGLRDSEALAHAESLLDPAGRAEATLVRALATLHSGDNHAAFELASTAAAKAREHHRDRLELRASVIAAIAQRIPSVDRHRALTERCTDPDLAWMARAVLHIAEPSDALLQEAKRDLTAVRASLPARYAHAYASVWWRAPLIARCSGQASEDRRFGRDVERLLAINRELARDHNPERLLERIIDAAIALSGAERGFLLLCVEGEEELAVRTARGTDARELTPDELDISRSIAREVITSGSPLSTIDAQHDDRFREFQSVHALRLRSVLCLPLRTGTATLGVVYLDHRYRASAFDDTDVALLSAFGDQAAIAIANARTLSELESRSAELEASRSAIEELNQRLATELHAREAELESVRSSGDPSDTGRHGLIGRSPPMREIFRVIDRVADKDVAVAITGESGTGKELVARAIHAASPSRRGPFVPVNCGAIPENLLESELFGHERGAFTGAVRAKAGLFEIARDGTLFLDEIGDMPLGMQVKLLRVLQSREFRRVGGTTDIATNTRIISATNKNLEALVRSGGFREDLWYRLNVVEMQLPSLRERKLDLPLLIEHLLEQHARGLDVKLSKRALATLLDHDWPGNVRELDNELQRAVALADGLIEPEVFSPKLKPRSSAPADEAASGTLKMILDRQERAVIKATLDEHHGRVAAAARALGLTRAGLYKKLHKYGLTSARDD